MLILGDKLEAKNLQLLSAIYRKVSLLGLGLMGFAFTIKMSALDLLLNWLLALQHGLQIFSGRMQMFYGIRQTNKTHLLHRCITEMHHHHSDSDSQQDQQDTNLQSSGKTQMWIGVMLEGLCTKVLRIHKLIFN